MAVIKKITNVDEDVEKREPLCSVGRNVNLCSHEQKTVLKFLKKAKNTTAIRTRNSTTGYLSKRREKTENANLKRSMHPNVHGNNSQDMETPKYPSTDEWINKM